MSCKIVGSSKLTCALLSITAVLWSLSTYGQCVGDTWNASITTSIGCGSGSAASWDGAYGGTIDESLGYITIVWQNSGTFRLKRTFPPCNGNTSGTTIYSEYYHVGVKPPTPALSEVSQTPACGKVTLTYSGSNSNTYWTSSPTTTEETYPITRIVTTTGSYYAKTKSTAGCWSDGRQVTINTIPASPVGGTLTGGGTFLISASPQLVLTGASGTVKEYWYNENGGPPVRVPGTSNTLNVSIVNSTSGILTRYYWAVLQLNGCEVNSASATISVNPPPAVSRVVCVGDISSMSLTNTIGCSYGNGDAVTLVGTGVGTVPATEALQSSFNVTWTAPGKVTILRYFNSQCSTNVLVGETVLINEKPAAPALSTISSVPGCSNLSLTYSGAPTGYWQNTINGFSEAEANVKVIVAPGDYYIKVKNGLDCWSNTTVVTVPTVPAPVDAGTLTGGGTFNEWYNNDITLSNINSSVIEWHYRENNGPDVTISSTATELPVLFKNSGSVPLSREYWAVAGWNTCTDESNHIVITLNPIKAIEIPDITYNCIPNSANISLYSDNADDRWYADEVSTSPLSTNNSITVGVTVTTYFLERHLTDGRIVRVPYSIDQTFSERCSEKVNYVKIYKPQQQLSALTKSEPKEAVAKNITYYDGTGRTLENIAIAQTPDGYDLFTFSMYDGNGREDQSYLPRPYNQGNGAFRKPAALLDQAAYNVYSNGFADKITDDKLPVSITTFEKSPLNRPLKVHNAGSSWHPASAGNPAGQDKYIEYKYLVNKHSLASDPEREKIYAWVIGAGESISLAPAVPSIIEPGGYYSSNQLQISVVFDEQRRQVREYRDKEGRVVLKKVQVTDAVNDLNSLVQWASTYYVYDDFGNLVSVLPPESIRALTGSN